jgi:hypothetical protein
MDDRQKNTVYRLYYEEKQKERAKFMMDVAEAVRMGNAGIHSKKANSLYFKWVKRLERVVNPKKAHDKNFWDLLKKRGKSVLLN